MTRAVQLVVPSWMDPRHGIPAMQAFREGLEALDVPHQTVSIDQAVTGPDTILVCWGVYKSKFAARMSFHALQCLQKNEGGELIIIERGFVRRENHYMVGRDDLNGRAIYPHDAPRNGGHHRGPRRFLWLSDSGAGPPDDLRGSQGALKARWEALGVPLSPWNRGDEILVVGQVPWDTSCQHVDQKQWVRDACKTARELYPHDRVVFRPHPLRPHAISHHGLAAHEIDRHRKLSTALARAKVVITFSSTVGVDALVAGVPVVACDPMSMVYDICPHNVGQVPWRPKREAWAHWIAGCQWSLEEMKRGDTWMFFHPEQE